MSRHAWMDSASCAQVDPDEWIDNLAGGGSHTARRICQRCPVRPQCAAHAAALEQHDGGSIRGIWGGLSQRQRRQQQAA
jgi:WhiB family redox-sensing transcriptional regulator